MTDDSARSSVALLNRLLVSWSIEAHRQKWAALNERITAASPGTKEDTDE